MTNATGDQSGGAQGTVEEAAPSTVPDATETWSDLYADARRWVEWTGRRRWPNSPSNDDVWALLIASWYLGERVIGRG